LVLKIVGVFYDSPTEQSNAIDAHGLLIKGGVAQILAKNPWGFKDFQKKIPGVVPYPLLQKFHLF
jgi:hypothetical protein